MLMYSSVTRNTMDNEKLGSMKRIIDPQSFCKSIEKLAKHCRSQTYAEYEIIN